MPKLNTLQTGIVLLAIMSALALLAPWIATDRPSSPIPYAPSTIDLANRLQAPSADHWLGTDALGRDFAARMIHGARVSLSVGFLAALFSLLIGLPLGSLSGMGGRWADMAVSRLIEAVLCFPMIILLLVLLALGPRWLGELGEVWRIAIVLGVSGWIPAARFLRAETRKVAASESVTAARAAGCGPLRLIWLHVLPRSITPALVTAAFAVGAAISVESAISFLGFGIAPPTPTWGGLLAEASSHLDRAWWLVLFPGLALFASIQACNLVGEGLRDWLDPERRNPA